MKEASQAEQILKKTAECCENLSLKGNKKKKKKPKKLLTHLQ